MIINMYIFHVMFINIQVLENTSTTNYLNRKFFWLLRTTHKHVARFSLQFFLSNSPLKASLKPEDHSARKTHSATRRLKPRRAVKVKQYFYATC